VARKGRPPALGSPVVSSRCNSPFKKHDPKAFSVQLLRLLKQGTAHSECPAAERASGEGEGANQLLDTKGYNLPSPSPKALFFLIHAIFAGTANALLHLLILRAFSPGLCKEVAVFV
jgi:hypothetical protein